MVSKHEKTWSSLLITGAVLYMELVSLSAEYMNLTDIKAIIHLKLSGHEYTYTLLVG